MGTGYKVIVFAGTVFAPNRRAPVQIFDETVPATLNTTGPGPFIVRDVFWVDVHWKGPGPRGRNDNLPA